MCWLPMAPARQHWTQRCRCGSVVEAEIGPLPYVLLVNKRDLTDQWVIPDADLDLLREQGWWVRVSSARTGEGVDDAFTDLADRITR